MRGQPELYYVDKDTPVPLYFQLKKRIHEMMEAGVLTVGDRLPTENELCEQLLVSRPTVRQALNELVNEGLLTRQKGKGTFVSRPKIDGRFFQKLESFDSEMQQKGVAPTTKVFVQKKVAAKEEVNNRLNLRPGEPLIKIERLRFANDEPMVWLSTYIPYTPYKAMLRQNFEIYSFYERMEQLFHARVHRVVREIEAVNATQRQGEKLGIEAGKAVCLVKTVGYTQENTPVEYSVACYRGDRNKFSVELYR